MRYRGGGEGPFPDGGAQVLRKSGATPGTGRRYALDYHRPEEFASGRGVGALPHKDHVGGTRGFSGIHAVQRGGRRVLFSTGDGGTAHVPLQDARVAGPARADDSGYP